ncbi:MAG: CHAT domain-containing protein [Archangium sp.]
MEGDDEAALAHAQTALELTPNHPQALWNRALALDRLGLPRIAAKAFHELEKTGVPGWSTEAAERAKVLDRSWDDGLALSQRALDAGARMALSGEPMPAELVRAMPAWSRMNFRYALLSAGTEAEVRALAPTAASLDATFGNSFSSTALARVATLDAKQRTAFSSRFKALLVDYYRALKVTGRAPVISDDLKGLGDAGPLVVEIRKAGAREYLLFAAPIGRQLATAWDDYAAAARADGDPWFGLAVDIELARRAGAAKNVGEQERKLLEVLEVARTQRVTLRLMQAGEPLIILYTAQHRILEATRIGAEVLQTARSQGDYPTAARVLHVLGDAARFRNASALSAAYLEERSLRLPDDCGARAYLHESLAAMAIVSLEPAKARAELDAVPVCETPFSVVGVHVLADLQRLAPKPEDAARFDAAIAALRAKELRDSDSLLLDWFEGLVWIDTNPAKGKERLDAALARAATLETGDAVPSKVIAYGRGVLRIAAGEAGKWTDVFAQLDPPAPARCALVVEVQDNRVVAALRTASGSDRGVARRFEFGPRRPEGLKLEEIAALVAPLVKEGAVGCDKLQVSASYPLHGRAAWLPDELAWSYAGGGKGAPVGQGKGLVVHDVSTPAELKLPRIGRWSDAPRPDDEELTGTTATPQRVLQAMQNASFIELHVHGQVNPADANTAALLLAPDETGRFRLTAEDLKTELKGSPVVVLGACRASSVAPFLHEPWSLPRAFLTAGAHSVVAAPVDLPDAEARAFFVKVVARLRAGQDAATALRDEKVLFLKEKPGAVWVRSVLVFE